MNRFNLVFMWENGREDNVFFDYFEIDKDGGYKLYLNDGTEVETYWGIIFCQQYAIYTLLMFNHATKEYDIELKI